MTLPNPIILLEIRRNVGNLVTPMRLLLRHHIITCMEYIFAPHHYLHGIIYLLSHTVD